MGLDEKKTQHAGLAFDVNSSLIYIEVTSGAAHALPLAARRICRLARFQDNVLLLERICALLLPATPFSGAQAVASRVSLLLADVPCELQVYHGATALLVMQHLCEAGAETISREECVEIPTPATQAEQQSGQAEKRETPLDTLPYLAFLANYPSPRLLQLFPYELACRYQCVPVGAERNMLTLATCQWLDGEIVAQLRMATRRGIFQVRCEVTIIDEVLRYWRRSQKTVDLACAELAMDGA